MNEIGEIVVTPVPSGETVVWLIHIHNWSTSINHSPMFNLSRVKHTVYYLLGDSYYSLQTELYEWLK